MRTHAIENSQSRRLLISLVITLAFVFLEALAGFLANSLALLTDAAHNLTDVIALAISWYAIRLTTRPANSEKTFGYHRAGILAALANSTTLIVIALAIFYEAYRRALNPPTVEANILIAVALLAFAVNAGTAWLVWRDSDHDLNMRSAFVHLAGDAVSTLGALVAGIGIALTGWQTLDPLISVLMGVLILIGAWRILRETVEILLEGTPHGLDLEEMVRDLMRMDGVRGVHDLHAWSINSHLRALSAHVLTDDVSLSDGARLQHEMNQLLRGKYAIEHTTLQLECVGCVPDELFCDMDGEGSGDQS